jgi:hypothetical protein
MRITIVTELRAGFDPNQPRDKDGKWTGGPGDLNVSVTEDLKNSTDGVPAEDVATDLGGETELELVPSQMTADEIQDQLSKIRHKNSKNASKKDRDEYAALYLEWLRAMEREATDPVVKQRFQDRIAENS